MKRMYLVIELSPTSVPKIIGLYTNTKAAEKAAFGPESTGWRNIVALDPQD